MENLDIRNVTMAANWNQVFKSLVILFMVLRTEISFFKRLNYSNSRKINSSYIQIIYEKY